MRTDAYFSPGRVYRYWLLRVWDDRLPIVANFGVNPSTADERENDPTIRKDIGFAARNGYGGLLKLNVGAFRATDPKKWRAAADPIGPENTPDHLRRFATEFKCDRVIAAWGKNGNYAPEACSAIVRAFPQMWCFGKNPDGTPRHTLMLPYTTAMELLA